MRTGLSPAAMSFLEGLDLDAMDAEAGAAAFWYVRNLPFLELGLDRRDDVLLVSYDRMVADPEPAMRPLCAFLGVTFGPELVAHIAPRGASERPPLPLPDPIRAACDELGARFRDVEARRAARA